MTARHAHCLNDKTDILEHGDGSHCAEEFDLVEFLHSWTLVQFDSARIELNHRDELSLTILLRPGGIVEDFEIILLDPASAGQQQEEVKRLLTGFLFDRLKAHLEGDIGLHARVRRDHGLLRCFCVDVPLFDWSSHSSGDFFRIYSVISAVSGPALVACATRCSS